MIIKRKSFTRQETKAMKEMYQALKKGNIGRGLSAKKFVKARHVSNETIDALISQETAPITNYTKNSQIINDIGLPETAKDYKRMMEKYTNPTLRKRFERVQAASSNNKLRVARQNVKNSGQFVTDPLTRPLAIRKQIRDTKISGSFDLSKWEENKSSNYISSLKNLEAVKKERVGRVYKFNRKEILSNKDKEITDLNFKQNQITNLIKEHNDSLDPESAQKIIKDLKKKGVKFTTDPADINHYNIDKDIINIRDKNSLRSPATILHENGHRISSSKGELKRDNFYGYHKHLNDNVNTSNNLVESIRNRVGTISTLMDEANASYHAAAHANKYDIPKEIQKSGKKHLSNASRIHEISEAKKIISDNTNRLLGKNRNK